MIACVVDEERVTTKLALVPAFVVRFAILIVGTTVIVAVPVVTPETALTIEDKFMVKFLPPLAIWVVTEGNVKVVAPAAMVALPAKVE